MKVSARISINLVAGICLILGAGCAYLINLPDSASEIDFDAPSGEWVSAWQYQIGHEFHDIDLELARKAAHAAFLYADISLESVDMECLCIKGSRTTDWEKNTIPIRAGVYLREMEASVKVRIYVSFGGRDFSEVGVKKVTGRILEGMELFINAERDSGP